MEDDAGADPGGVLTLTPDFPDILQHFDLSGHFVSGVRIDSGHINDTFLVCISHADDKKRYVLQKMNRRVFPEPELVMANVDRVSEHIRTRASPDDSNQLTRQSQLMPFKTRDGDSFCRDGSGEIWRLWPFISGASTFETVQSPGQAREAAAAFACFQNLVHDLPAPRLHETISQFHDTPARFAQFHQALLNDSHNRSRHCRTEIDIALGYENGAGILCDLLERGEIPERVVHNDAKINNVMFDDVTGRAVCVIDLDTVMPGSSLFDFGDLVRTAAMSVAEDETNLRNVSVQMEMYENLVDGYLSEAIDFLVGAEIDNLAIAGKIITLETGLRFLTDYLGGDEYFKTERPNQNLDRCRTQFALAESIDTNLDAMNGITQTVYKRLANER